MGDVLIDGIDFVSTSLKWGAIGNLDTPKLTSPFMRANMRRLDILMQAENELILVAGATGGIGQLVVAKLLEVSECQRRTRHQDLRPSAAVSVLTCIYMLGHMSKLCIKLGTAGRDLDHDSKAVSGKLYLR